EFDFIDHTLRMQCSDGSLATLDLRPQTVADFYEEVMDALHGLGIDVKIWPMPVEIPNPIRFDQDQIHKSYDADYVNRWWRALVSIDDVFKDFRARFIGKVSPVHFWWGSFGHALLRTPRAAARRRRQNHHRGLLTRSYQSWILARRQRRSGCILFLHRTR